MKSSHTVSCPQSCTRKISPKIKLPTTHGREGPHLHPNLAGKNGIVNMSISSFWSVEINSFFFGCQILVDPCPLKKTHRMLGNFNMSRFEYPLGLKYYLFQNKHLVLLWGFTKRNSLGGRLARRKLCSGYSNHFQKSLHQQIPGQSHNFCIYPPRAK